MEKQLLGYTINGQVVGIDILQWNIPNYGQAYLIINSGSTIPSGYTNISSIINWDQFGITIAIQFLTIFLPIAMELFTRVHITEVCMR